MQFKQGELEMALREILVDIAQDLSGEGGGRKVNTQEVEEMSKLKEAHESRESAASIDKIGGIMAIIPTFGAHVQPLGPGGSISFGGSNLAAHTSFISSLHKADADTRTYEAGKASRISSYVRREMDWAFQSNLAVGEINQIFKQLRAAQIREAIAEREWNNHQQQIKNAEEIEYFLTAEKNPDWKYKLDGKQDPKKTNRAFYTWMKREVKGLYGRAFHFAYDVACKAERALQHELGNPQLSFLQFGYLGGREGLLAGEKLYLDIKRMEMAYHDLNQREYELTKHVSLQQVNPLALLQLRTTGRCTVFLPEELFDMDCPGHYFRRIKSVAVSIPCVVGPYTSVNCTLTLLKSAIRKNSLLRDGSYARESADDDRFSDNFGSLQTIVTSTGQNDSGLFETNLRDERYLPFEGSGVVSEWQLELPADLRQFNYDTIADVIIHFRYTAREGGGLLRKGATTNLRTRIGEAQTAGAVRLFSVRHEFPSEWAKFKSAATPPVALTLNLREEHYPFWSKDNSNQPIIIKRLGFFAKPSAKTNSALEVSDKPTAPRNTDKLEKDISLGNLRIGELKNIPLPAPTGEFTLYFNDNSMEDLWLTLAWGQGD